MPTPRSGHRRAAAGPRPRAAPQHRRPRHGARRRRSATATVDVLVALTVAGCPLRGEIDEPSQRAPSARSTGVRDVGLDFTVMTDEERAGAAPSAARRPAATAGRSRRTVTPRVGPSRSPTRLADPRAAHRVRQGRRRQVVGHDEPRRRAGRSGATRSASSTPTCGASRSRACSASIARRWSSTRCCCRPKPTACAASRSASSPTRTSPSSGAVRCCTRRSSSSSPTSTGTSPTSCSSTCRPAPATSRSRSSQFLPRAEVYVVTTPQPAAQKVAQRAAAHGPEGPPRASRASSRTCPGSPATTASATSCSAPAAARALAERLEVPLIGQVPLVPAMREGGDDGRPIVAVDPDSEAARSSSPHCRADRRRTRPDAPLPSRVQDRLNPRGSPRYAPPDRHLGEQAWTSVSGYCTPPRRSRSSSTTAVDRDKLKATIDDSAHRDSKVLWLTDKQGPRGRHPRQQGRRTSSSARRPIGRIGFGG